METDPHEIELIELFLQQDAELKRLFEALPILKEELNGELRLHLDRLAGENDKAAQASLAQSFASVQEQLKQLAHTELSNLRDSASRTLADVAESERKAYQEQYDAKLKEIELAVPAQMKAIVDEAFKSKRHNFEKQTKDQIAKALEAAPKATFFDWFRGNWNVDTVYRRGDILAFRGSCYIVAAANGVKGEFPTQENQKGPAPLYQIIAAAGSPGLPPVIPADVVKGPATSTDNAIARFDGTTGKLLQNSIVTVSDAGVVSIAGTGGSNLEAYVATNGTTTAKTEFKAADDAVVYGATSAHPTGIQAGGSRVETFTVSGGRMYGHFGGTAAAATVKTRVMKAVTGIADGVATAVLTATIPNAAQSGSLRVTLVGSLGAGGAIGANEATGTVSYDFAITRTAGVNAVTTISTAYGSGMASVAGAATITVTAAASAIAGAVGVANTFTVNVTITAGSGAATNHTCTVFAEVINANANGITLS